MDSACRVPFQVRSKKKKKEKKKKRILNPKFKRLFSWHLEEFTPPESAISGQQELTNGSCGCIQEQYWRRGSQRLEGLSVGAEPAERGRLKVYEKSP